MQVFRIWRSFRIWSVYKIWSSNRSCEIWIAKDLDHERFGSRKIWIAQDLDPARFGSRKIFIVQVFDHARFVLKLSIKTFGHTKYRFMLNLDHAILYESCKMWIVQSLDFAIYRSCKIFSSCGFWWEYLFKLWTSLLPFVRPTLLEVCAMLPK